MPFPKTPYQMYIMMIDILGLRAIKMMGSEGLGYKILPKSGELDIEEWMIMDSVDSISNSGGAEIIT
jgi:hypothetical protein